MSPNPVSKAAVLHAASDLRVEERPLRSPPAGHAQVQVMATTLCGSDLHYYIHGRNGNFVLQHPLVLGHESAGIVTAVGPGVTSLRPGMRVAIECGVPCKASSCTRCVEGRYNLCPKMRFCSSAKTTPHLDGTLQQRFNHPADLLHPLPPSLSFEHGALAEPLGVVLHASRRATIAPGMSVLVFGAGAVGLLACALARAQGASTVVCVDVNDRRLDFARSNGFVNTVVNTATISSPSQPPQGTSSSTTLPFQDAMDRAQRTATAILHKAGMPADTGFDVIFECTGAEPCIQTAIYSTRPGGKVMLVGMGTPNVALPLSAAACREVDLIGVFRYANTYPASLALLASGALDGVEKMITHRLPLQDAKRAFSILQKGADEDGGLAVKVCIVADS